MTSIGASSECKNIGSTKVYSQWWMVAFLEGKMKGLELVKVRALGPGKVNSNPASLHLRCDILDKIILFLNISALSVKCVYVGVLELRDSFIHSFIHSMRWFGLAHSWERSFSGVSYYFVDNFFQSVAQKSGSWINLWAALRHTEFSEWTHQSRLRNSPRLCHPPILKQVPPLQLKWVSPSRSIFHLYLGKSWTSHFLWHTLFPSTVKSEVRYGHFSKEKNKFT